MAISASAEGPQRGRAPGSAPLSCPNHSAVRQLPSLYEEVGSFVLLSVNPVADTHAEASESASLSIKAFYEEISTLSGVQMSHLIVVAFYPC